jgi:hypothetical protein
MEENTYNILHPNKLVVLLMEKLSQNVEKHNYKQLDDIPIYNKDKYYN